jgi:predicted permease
LYHFRTVGRETPIRGRLVFRRLGLANNVRRDGLMSKWLSDARLTFRQLSKNRGFSILVIGSLALGIGATAAMFSLIDGVVLRPLPFPQSERLIWMEHSDHTPGAPPTSTQALSYPDYFDWRAQSHSFEEIASYRNSGWVLTGAGEPRQIEGGLVSANLFRALGVRPIVGRDFLAQEEKPGTRVAMLSYRLWQSAFGGVRSIAGSSITLDGGSYTVAGVMPASFRFLPGSPELWTTLAPDVEGHGKTFLEQRGVGVLNILGRLKPGVTLGSARADLDVIERRLAAQYPGANKYLLSAFAEPLSERLVHDYRPALWMLFAAVLLLLLIACANAAGVLLVRAARRKPEIAVRAALGASRGAILRQILAESVLLGLSGGAVGALLSGWMLNAFLRYVPQELPRADQIAVDARVLLFVCGISVLTGIGFGVAPAWHASRLDPAAAMRDLGRGATAGRSRTRLHNWIVVGETAIGLVLLAGSGLLIRSFVNVLRVNPGFDPHHVLTAYLSLPDRMYSPTQRVEFYNALLRRLAGLPGVESVGAGDPLPLANNGGSFSFEIEGKPVPSGDEPSEDISLVTAGFLPTLRIPVLAGRDFTERDDPQGQPVMLVNEAFAKKYFPGQNPIGKRIHSDAYDAGGKMPVREVVGVVGNVKHENLTVPPDPVYYLPWMQMPFETPRLCIRTTGDPGQLAGAVRAEIAKLDAGIPLYRVQPMESLVSNAAAQPKFQMLLVTGFALLALALSAVGLYAVLAYLVAQRTAEIGLRIALGARRGDVMGWVLRRGLALTVGGIAIGLAGAAALTRFLRELLFGVEPLDGLTLTVVIAVLLVVAVAASSVPAWRAARVDPLEALREQ